uniref:Uncharacterized protein n=1 Tax=Phasianus colchicus TaxID=9054 RepID=A0A669P2T9_PHACC
HSPICSNLSLELNLYFLSHPIINIANADKVSKINKAFAEIQKEVQQLSKGTAAEPPKNQKVTTPSEEEPANVDAATDLLSQL